MRSLAAFVALAGLLLAGCESDPTAPRVEEAVFNPSLEVNLAASTRTITGLYYRDEVVGTGAEAVNGRTARVDYEGYLVTGSQFDSSASRGPLRLVVGAGSVIPGFDEGVRGMRVGGVRQLIIPPSLGYGAQPNGPIPANSILVFNIELVGVE